MLNRFANQSIQLDVVSYQFGCLWGEILPLRDKMLAMQIVDASIELERKILRLRWQCCVVYEFLLSRIRSECSWLIKYRNSVS